MFAFAICTVASAFREREPFRPHLLYVPLCFAAVWPLFQLFLGHSVSPSETRLAILLWSTVMTSFAVTIRICASPGQAGYLRRVIIWFGFVLSVQASLQVFTSAGKVFWLFTTQYRDLVMGPVLYHNHYSVLMELILPLVLFESLRNKRNSLLYLIMSAAIYASVIASTSRAGVILSTAEIIVVLMLSWRAGIPGRVIGASLAKLASVLAVFTLVVGWETIWRRLMQADPFFLRREFQISSLAMIGERPWFGFGLGTWSIVYPQFAVIDIGHFANQAHCEWLGWTAEGGLPFGLAMLSVFLWALRPAIRTIWGLGVISVFLHALVDYPFSRPALAVWPFVILAMMAASRIPDRAERLLSKT
jgi:hypothetical protein